MSCAAHCSLKNQVDILDTVLESSRVPFHSPLQIGGSFAWISDFEIPYHDAKFINKVFTLAKFLGVRQCVWAGDAFHLEAFSPFPGADTDADKEISEIDEFLPGFLEPFDNIFYFCGNHDQRIWKALSQFGMKISMEHAARMLIAPETVELFREKVQFSSYRWAETKGEAWLLEHAKNASVIPGRVAQGLVSKFHRNVAQAHTHLYSKSRFNGYWAIETGCCADPERLAYQTMTHNTRTGMQRGAMLMLWNGETYTPLDLCPENIDALMASYGSLTSLLTIKSKPKSVRQTR